MRLENQLEATNTATVATFVLKHHLRVCLFQLETITAGLQLCSKLHYAEPLLPFKANKQWVQAGTSDKLLHNC